MKSISILITILIFNQTFLQAQKTEAQLLKYLQSNAFSRFI